MITSEMVKELREKTGAGIVDCKKFLEKADGNMEKAIEFLREKGLASAAKKASRIASEGVVESYIHAGGRIGALVEVNCETDFVANNQEFKDFVKDVCLQVAACNPLYVSREEVPAEVIEKEKEIYIAEAKNNGKPDNIAEKIATGKLEKYYKEVCLLDQPFVKNPDQTVQDLLTEKIAKIGEKISIRRFTRYERGEGLEKKVENFAEEVAKQLK